MFNPKLKEFYSYLFTNVCFVPRTDYDFCNKEDICSKIMRYYGEQNIPGLSFCIASKSEDENIQDWYKEKIDAKINQNLDLDFILCIENKTGDFFMVDKLYFWY